MRKVTQLQLFKKIYQVVSVFCSKQNNMTNQLDIIIIYKAQLARVLSAILLLLLDTLYSELCSLLFDFVKPLLFNLGQNWLHQILHVKHQCIVVLR